MIYPALMLLFAAGPPVGVPLPEGAIARLGSTRFRHGYQTTGVAYSPDGRLLASCGLGRGLCLWDARTGELHLHHSDHPFGTIWAVAFSPDGRSLVATSIGRLFLLDVTTGKEIRQFEGPRIQYLPAFSAGGDWVASGDAAGTVRIWSVKTGRVLNTLAPVAAGGPSVVAAPLPHASLLAVSSRDGTLSVWDAATGARKWQVVAHAPRPRTPAVAYHPRGTMLATAGDDGTVRLWSPEGRPVRVLALGRPVPCSITFHPGGALAVGFRDGTIRLYDTRSGKETRRWDAGPSLVSSLSCSPSGRELVSAGLWPAHLSRWDARTGELLAATCGHTGPVEALRFRPDGKLLSVGHDRRLVSWGLADGTESTLPLSGIGGSGLLVLALSAEGDRLAVGDPARKSVIILDAVTGKPRLRITDRAEEVAVLSFSPDGKRLAGHGRGELRVWDAATGKRLLLKNVGVAQGKPSLDVSPPGDRVLVKGDNGYHLIDVRTGATIRSLALDDSAESGATFAPDGRLVVVGAGLISRVISLWDSHTGRIVRSWTSKRSTSSLKQSAVYGAVFSPDGRFVASACDENWNGVAVWEVASGQLVREWTGHHSGVPALAWSADCRILASGAGDSTVVLWDVTGRAVAGRLRPAALTAQEGRERWRLMGGAAGRAAPAAWELIAWPGAVSLLAGRMIPLEPIGAKRLRLLCDRLDAEEIATREAAAAELEMHGPGAAGAMREALRKEGRLEVIFRLKRQLEAWESSAEGLRQRRAIMVLEQMNTAESRALLKKLAGGAPGADLTEEARRALDRLGRAKR